MEKIKALVHVTVDEQGRILIPKVVRETLNIKTGDKFRLVGEEDRITLTKIS